MLIKEAISQLQTYNGPLGLTLHKGADEESVRLVEMAYNVTLPSDFKELYRFSDGFETVEDIFNMIPLAEIIDNQKRHINDPLYIAEYMIYSDMWQLKINQKNPDEYSISVVDFQGRKIVLTNSLGEFISRFLKGGVFEIGGLYAWADEIRAKQHGNTDPVKIKPLLWVYRECLKRGLSTKEHIVRDAEWTIATEKDPHHFFIEMSRSRNVNELIAVLESVQLSDNILQVRAFFYVIYAKLVTDKIIDAEVISILQDFSQDGRFTKYESNKIVNLIAESEHLKPVIRKKRQRQQLHKNINDFFRNYMLFNLHHQENWEKINADLVVKFGRMDIDRGLS